MIRTALSLVSKGCVLFLLLAVPASCGLPEDDGSLTEGDVEEANLELASPEQPRGTKVVAAVQNAGTSALRIRKWELQSFGRDRGREKLDVVGRKANDVEVLRMKFVISGEAFAKKANPDVADFLRSISLSFVSATPSLRLTHAQALDLVRSYTQSAAAAPTPARASATTSGEENDPAARSTRFPPNGGRAQQPARGGLRSEWESCTDPLFVHFAATLACVGGVPLTIVGCTGGALVTLGTSCVLSAAITTTSCAVAMYEWHNAHTTCLCQIAGISYWGPSGTGQFPFCSCDQENANENLDPSASRGPFPNARLYEVRRGMFQCLQCPKDTSVDVGSARIAGDETCKCNGAANQQRYAPIRVTGTPGGPLGSWDAQCDECVVHEYLQASDNKRMYVNTCGRGGAWHPGGSYGWPGRKVSFVNGALSTYWAAGAIAIPVATNKPGNIHVFSRAEWNWYRTGTPRTRANGDICSQTCDW